MSLVLDNAHLELCVGRVPHSSRLHWPRRSPCAELQRMHDVNEQTDCLTARNEGARMWQLESPTMGDIVLERSGTPGARRRSSAGICHGGGCPPWHRNWKPIITRKKRNPGGAASPVLLSITQHI